LGVTTEVTVRLYGVPAAISSAVCSFPSVEAAVNVVIKTIQASLLEVLTQFRDSVGVGPCLATVVARPSSPEGVVCLIDKGAVEFQRISLSPASKQPVREPLDGFVDE
jgi:FAD/FMN-containing dehydrogenase